MFASRAGVLVQGNSNTGAVLGVKESLRHEHSFLQIMHQPAQWPTQRAKGFRYCLRDQIVVRIDLKMRGLAAGNLGQLDENLAQGVQPVTRSAAGLFG